MPFAIADRWSDANGDSRYDEGEMYDPELTGYRGATDRGLALDLSPGNPVTATMTGTYLPVAFPPLGGETEPLTGDAWFRQWVSECAPYAVADGDSLWIEPGNLLSTLLEELSRRIAADPGARWDEGSRSVQGSAYESTPRLVAVSCYDPRLPPTSTAPRLCVRKIALVFLESTEAPASVHVRFVNDASSTVSIEPTTWGKMKHQFGLPK